MPIFLETPAPVVISPTVAHEIVSFAVNLQAMTAAMEFVSIDADGIKRAAFGITCNLLANGSPRFTPTEYSSIKAALYRLAIEDGHVSGVIA